MYAYSIPYTMRELESIKWTWAEPFELKVKIEQWSKFAVDIESCCFFDA